MTRTLHEPLARYFAGRRWFSGKGRDFVVTHLHPLPWFSEADPLVRVEIVTVQYDDGTLDTYQVPLAYLLEPDESMAYAYVGEVDDPELGTVSAYDAVFFKTAADQILEAFHTELTTDAISFRSVKGAELPPIGSAGSVMTGEQSNTSIAYGEDGILKLFRRVAEGGNPDIEIHEALTRHGSEHIAPLLGWISGTWRDVDGAERHGHLGMLQVFLRTATDGWTIALSSVRDLLVEEDLHADEVGADFAGEAQRLGEATAAVHADLAAMFDTATLTPDQGLEVATAMNLRLDTASAVVPELADLADGVRHRYDALAALDAPLPVQRVHGDLHLGQTLRTVKGWKIIDFEGEPAKSLAERVALDSPLRDVAGMLRSLDYAAGATLREFGTGDQLGYRADEWAARNRGAFLDGYASVSSLDLSAAADTTTIIRAYEADKAVYEAVYEARNRPSWLPIPLHAVARLATEE